MQRPTGGVIGTRYHRSSSGGVTKPATGPNNIGSADNTRYTESLQGSLWKESQTSGQVRKIQTRSTKQAESRATYIPPIILFSSHHGLVKAAEFFVDGPDGDHGLLSSTNVVTHKESDFVKGLKCWLLQ